MGNIGQHMERRSVRVGVTKMDVSRDIVGTLCLKTKERELVVGDA